MRTTVTLDDDTREVIRQRMHRDAVSFKQALNEAIRQGAAATQEPAAGERYALPTASMGREVVDLTKALRLAADLEDEEIIGKMALGK